MSISTVHLGRVVLEFSNPAPGPGMDLLIKVDDHSAWLTKQQVARLQELLAAWLKTIP